MKTSRAIVFGGGLRQRWRPDLHNPSVATVRGADDGVGWRRRCLASWRAGRRRLTGLSTVAISARAFSETFIHDFPVRLRRGGSSQPIHLLANRSKSGRNLWSNFPDMRILPMPWGKPVHAHDVRGSELRDQFAAPMISRGVLVGVLLCGPSALVKRMRLMTRTRC
jgi:hypothetical protein